MSAKTNKQKIELLLNISGLSETHAKEAVETLGVDSLDRFIEAGQKGDLQNISGIGKKREASLLVAALEFQASLESKSRTETAKKKNDLSEKNKAEDSKVSSPNLQARLRLEKVTLPKLALRLFRKVVTKALKNR